MEAYGFNMPCYKPLDGWRSKDRHPVTGRRSIVFNAQDALLDMPVTLPCGQCIGCRLERSRQWAIRCVHEASLYEKNCFVTLTFDNAHLPADGSLDVRTFQLFMKRLRKRFGDGIRFFHCGEYGEKMGRPHYHACLFNFDFEDKQLWKESNGFKLYVSEALAELWPFGYSMIGEVTFESAAYVARYIMKKISGEEKDEHYQGRKPEYTTMSRRPGIGRGWYDNFRGDVYPDDFVILKNTKMRPPKFYDSLFELDDPEGFAKLKRKRVQKAGEHNDNNSSPRLMVREECQKQRCKRLLRNYENG